MQLVSIYLHGTRQSGGLCGLDSGVGWTRYSIDTTAWPPLGHKVGGTASLAVSIFLCMAAG